MVAASLVVTSGAIAAGTAKPPVFGGDPVAGKIKLEAERCLECHDANGQDSSNGPLNKFATLSGQYPGYIVKQVQDFRHERRHYDFMTMMAGTLSDTDLFDIAAYFGTGKKMQADGGVDSPVARKLFQNGDPARAVIACVACHGVRGQGAVAANVIYPVIGGQQWSYLEQQLRDWRSGERKNSPGNVMNGIAKSLTDEELLALSHYIAGL